MWVVQFLSKGSTPFAPIWMNIEPLQFATENECLAAMAEEIFTDPDWQYRVTNKESQNDKD